MMPSPGPSGHPWRPSLDARARSDAGLVPDLGRDPVPDLLGHPQEVGAQHAAHLALRATAREQLVHEPGKLLRGGAAHGAARVLVRWPEVGVGSQHLVETARAIGPRIPSRRT